MLAPLPSELLMTDVRSKTHSGVLILAGTYRAANILPTPVV